MVMIPFMLFSGFLTNTENILPPLKFFEYISPLRYTFEYFIRNEFENDEYLGESNPIKTLNFSMSKPLIILILVIMFFVYIIFIITFLKLTTKNVKN